MVPFRLNKSAALLMPLSLGALPALASGYAGYLRTQPTRQSSTSIHSHGKVPPSPSLVAKQNDATTIVTIEKGQSHRLNEALSLKNKLTLIRGTAAVEVMIIDASLEDKSLFYKALKPGIDVIEIDDSQPIFSQLNDKLTHYSQIEAIHWVSHGQQGQLHIGQQHIDTNQLENYLNDLKFLGEKLTANADIQFYNCNLGQGEQGEKFVELIAAATGADVAASNDFTGNANQGADWELEVVRGDINTDRPFSISALKDFSSVLGIPGTIQFTVAGDVGTSGGAASYNASYTNNGFTIIGNGTDIGTYIGANYDQMEAGAAPSQNYESQLTLYFSAGESFDATSIYLYNITAAGARTFTITSDVGGDLATSPSINSFSGQAVTLTGFEGITKLYITPNSPAQWGVDNLVMSFSNTDPVISIDNTVLGFTEGTGVTQIDSAATLSDSDGDADWNGGTLVAQITANNEAADQLSIPDNVVGTINTSGTSLLNGGTTIGTLSASEGTVTNGTSLTITFNANATNALVQQTLRAIHYNNTSNTPGTSNRTVTVTATDKNAASAIDTRTISVTDTPDSDGDVIAGSTVIEPIGLDTTADTVGEAVDLFDFTIVDGGTSDGLPMTVSDIIVRVAGTTTDTDRSNITWRLNGSDVTNVTGTYDTALDRITFSGLSISIADGTSETYTVNGYYNDNTNVTEDSSFILIVEGDVNLTIGASGTQMGSTPAITNSTGGTLDVTATSLVFSTQPSGSISGSALSTQPVITAQDAFGNTDVDFSETVTLTEASAGVLTNNTTVASNGIATFSSLTYTATADQQSFVLTANDQDGVGSNIPSTDANSVTSDVVATKLIYAVEPAPTTIASGQLTSFTTVPVVHAVDAVDVIDSGYATDITISEVNGPATANLSGTGDKDANASSVTITPSAGIATFTGLDIEYSLTGALDENFNLRAISGGLSNADSVQITATDTAPPSVTSISLVGTPVANASSITYTVNFSKSALNISSDDFTLTTVSGTATGAVASVSASSGSSVNVVVNTLSGDGDVRLDLNANTNITDSSGNGNGNNGYTPAYTSGDTHTADLIGPTITSVSIPDSAHKVGDVVTVSISADEAGATLNGGTLNGYTLTNFSDLTGGSYSAQFTVADGGTDVDAASDVAVNITLEDALSNQSNYTTAISQSSDAIYANLPSVTLTVDSNTVAENGGSVQLSANLNSSLNNEWPETVTVGLSYSGTATITTDYSTQASIDITANSSTQAITVTSIADDLYDALSNETIIVDIDTVSVGTEQGTQQQTITITDEQSAPSVLLSSAAASINENGGSTSLTATISNKTFESVIVSLGLSGTATSGTDYSAPSASITIPAGSISANAAQGITAIDDSIEDVNEQVIVDISAVSGGGASESGVQQVTVVINDDDDTTAPAISSVQVPVAGTYTGTQVMTFTINTDEVVSVTGSPSLNIEIAGQTKQALFSGGNNTQALQFSYTVENDLEDDAISVLALALNGGSISDASNNDLNLALNNVGSLAGIVVDSLAPSVINVTSTTADGSYTVGENINITVTFSEAVNILGGSPEITLETGATDRAASYTSGSASTALSFIYQVQTGDVSSDLAYIGTTALASNGATIRDTAGNDASLTLPAIGSGSSLSGSKDIIIDTQAPTAPIVTSPSSVQTVTTSTINIAGTHAENNVSVSLYLDANNDGVADSPTALDTIVVSAGLWSFSTNLQLGANDFVVAASDIASNRSSDVSVPTITREEPNQAPVISGTPASDVVAGQAYSFVPTASDPEDDTLTFSIVNMPSWANFNTSTGALTGTPADADVGSFANIQISVSDGDLSAQLPAFSITVNAANQAPVISGTPASDVVAGQAYSFVPTASDPEDDALTYSIVNMPSWASFNTSTGALTGTPADADVGSFANIQISVSDGDLSAQLPAFSITVTAANQAPVISGTPASDVVAGQAYSFVPAASDPEDDALTFSIVNMPSWASFNTSTGALMGTPADADVGSFANIQISVSDGDLSAQLPAFSITVTAANQAPVISGTPASDVVAGQAYSFVPTASDPEDDALTFSIVNMPSWASFNTSTGALTGTPADADVGSFANIQISVSDGDLSAQLPAFSITVTAANQAPVISGTPASDVVAGQAYSFVPTASDPEDDALTFSIVNMPSWASFNTNTGALTGSPADADVGSFANIQISVSDGDLSAQLPAFSITVTAANQAPVISGTPASDVVAGQEYSFVPTASDPEDDTLTFSIVNMPSWASFNTSNGALTGTPADADVGSFANIQISVSDGDLSAQLAAFSITVTAANQAPVINSHSLTGEEDTTATLLLDITDETPDSITVSVQTPPIHGNAEIIGLQLNYTPDENFQGEDSLVLVASDGELQSEPTTILITINAQNDDPVAVDDAFTPAMAADHRYELDVLANDYDVDQDDELTLTSASADIGDVSIVDNILVYIAPAGLTEAITLRYRIADKAGADAYANVRFAASGDLPEGSPVITVPADVNANATGLYTKVDFGTATAVDAQGNAIAVRLLDNPVYFTSGLHTVYWQATDSENRSALVSQRITVNPLISFAADSLATEGGEHRINAYLSGDAPVYPLVVPYTVAGTSDNADHALMAGELVFNAKQTALVFDVYADGQDEDDESIIVSLSEDVNRAPKWQHTATITERNLAPRVHISAMQNAQPLTLFALGSDIELHASVTDPNHTDTHSYEWRIEPTAPLTAVQSATTTLDTTALAVGVYEVKVTVTDDNPTPLSTTVTAQLDIREQLPELGSGDSDGDLIPDDEEGFTDSDGDGVPDYLDATGVCSVLAASPTLDEGFLVESEFGTCAHASSFADGAFGGAQLLPSAVDSDEQTRHVGTLYALIITDMSIPGDNVSFVLPQRQPIPANAMYRKFIDGTWRDLVIDENNVIASALGSRGFCPAPQSEVWQPGLTQGHWCVQLTLQEGGANDADATINGNLIDPGVIAVALDANHIPVAQDDSYEVVQNSTATFDALSNDSDEDGDLLTIDSVESEFGVATVVDNQIHYEAPMMYLGDDVLLYTIADSHGNTHSAFVHVSVVANQAPIANDDVSETWYRTRVFIDVLANDTDPEGQQLTLVSAETDFGEVTINDDGTLTFIPMDEFSGDALVTYTIADELGATDSAQIVITVAPKQPPVEPPKNKLSSGALMHLLWLLALVSLFRLRVFKR
ncbi:Ig-like domain-containing protein [Pseudoalteromonas sp. GB56]